MTCLHISSVLCPDCDNPGSPIRGVDRLAGFVPGHFDTPPQNAITAEQVRDMKRRAAPHGDSWEGESAWRSFYGNVLSRLLTHPGCSSAARAVIEACLE